MSRSLTRLCSLLIVAGLLIPALACGGKKPPPPPPPAPKPTPPPPPPPAPTEVEIFNRMTLAELNAKKVLEDVFFEYDKAELSDQARASLDKNAQYLRRWTSTTINVEGHADSRGTNEYNLSLGERRASVVRDYLVSLGVPVARINIVSLGEEQPVCREDAESCWSQNRRGHFVFTAK